MDLAINNLQRLICHKIKPANKPANQLIIFNAQSAGMAKYTVCVSAEVQDTLNECSWYNTNLIVSK